MRKKILLSFYVTLLCCIQAKAQVGINTEEPDQSAYLDISGTQKGLLPPRMTNQQRDSISNPAMGLIIFSTTDVTLQQNTGSPETPLWSNIGSNSLDWFYSPITLIEVTAKQEYTKDLYADYASRFKQALQDGKQVDLQPYAVTDLEYYIIGYDEEAFPSVQISNTGVLTYTPDPTKITDKSYLNIIFKLKKK